MQSGENIRVPKILMPMRENSNLDDALRFITARWRNEIRQEGAVNHNVLQSYDQLIAFGITVLELP